jgi:thiamine-phosphate diphosphorylase
VESPLGRIHLIADLDVLDARADAVDRITELLAAGLPSLSLRGPGRPPADMVRAGRPLRDACRKHGAFFVVNGPEPVVRELDADGWHRPAAADAPPRAWDRPWGRSAHDAGELTRAASAHWVFVSPVFPTVSKPAAIGIGLGGLAALAERSKVPVYALGGITANRDAPCRAAGAAGVAAVRGLLGPGGEDWVRRVVSA